MSEKRPNLLVVDDEKNTREALRRVLEDSFEVFTTTDVRGVKKLLESETMDAVLTDLKLGNESGMQVVDLCRQEQPTIPCVVMTAYGSVETAVEAMRKGAYDYVTKPLDLERVEMLLRRAVRSIRVEEENIRLKAELGQAYGLEKIIARCPAMQEVLDRIRQVADSKASVLIEGESGTGKELVARAIHGLSPRRAGPFVAVHCAALSPQLLESELFGHEKGAFTGAIDRRVGRFEQAQGGTLFLDEIGEIDATTQVKLLRVLGERTLERVGGNQLIPVDVRLVAATNRNLEVMVKEGKFREDLFFRIRVVQILLPPLRERVDDIPVLADHFLRDFSKENQKTGLEFSRAVLNQFTHYRWPGNIRELRTAVEHGVVMTKGKRVEVADLPPGMREVGEEGQGELVNRKGRLEDMENEAIQNALVKSGRNITEAAKQLGISRRTLHRKLAESNQTDRRKK
ncbi:MAG: sigma-54-dependent Fis family transcriptional regulator [Verrucomicrobia bacterium]|nr:sigma-54-dependent Fis family transcriptional regulator [Verrucomicrobiota bacterium]